MSKIMLFFVLVIMACSLNAQQFPQNNPAAAWIANGPLGYLFSPTNGLNFNQVKPGPGHSAMMTDTSTINKDGKEVRYWTLQTNDNGKVETRHGMSPSA